MALNYATTHAEYLARKGEQYITAEEAQKLGVGKAEWKGASGAWYKCGEGCGYHSYFKYRAIKQTEPHAELIANLQTQRREYLALEAQLADVKKDAELMPLLKDARYELHACQEVIHLAGGFNPAYVSGAQKVLKAIDAVIAEGKAC